ncbi:hypothetical protein DNTS_008913 [Danionella cerebrum]|uniref:Diphthine--ammonia ligase n=1 Tax=Danionella cerebrum TaxID=2873325 RepID=A0A553NW97_9TELE|nr:hypothetical protein DNTS_008913 [Danionella translucida]
MKTLFFLINCSQRICCFCLPSDGGSGSEVNGDSNESGQELGEQRVHDLLILLPQRVVSCYSAVLLPRAVLLGLIFPPLLKRAELSQHCNVFQPDIQKRSEVPRARGRETRPETHIKCSSYVSNRSRAVFEGTRRTEADQWAASRKGPAVTRKRELFTRDTEAHVSAGKMRVVALISGGKDSCYNMLQCVSAGHSIVALANLRPLAHADSDELDSFMYQTVGHQGVSLIAEAMDLPLYRRHIQGTSLDTSREYSQTEGDEVEDLYQLLKHVKGG